MTWLLWGTPPIYEVRSNSAIPPSYPRQFIQNKQTKQTNKTNNVNKQQQTYGVFEYLEDLKRAFRGPRADVFTLYMEEADSYTRRVHISIGNSVA